MAIIIDESPEEVLLSKNPIVFELSTENYVTTEGVKSAKRIDFSATSPADGDTIEISAPGFLTDDIDGDSITFTFRASPDDSGEELPIGNPTELTWVQQVADYMGQNATFNTHYETYLDGFGGSLTMRARLEGADWEPTFTFTFTGTDPSITMNVIGVDAELTEDFQVRARVILDKGFGELITGEFEYKTPNPDGTLVWDFSKTVDKLFPVDWLETSTLNDSFSMIEAPNTGAAFMKVEFSEFYGENPSANPVKFASPFTVLKGGFRTYDKAKNIRAAVVNDNKFLTWRPLKNHIFQEARDWLHFVNIDPSESRTSLNLCVRITNDDGSITQFLDLSTINLNYQNLYENNQVITVPCGYEQLNLDLLNFGNTPFKYELWIRDNAATILFDPVTFYIKKASKTATQIVYYNSFGLEEGLSLEGERTLNVENTFETLRLPENLSPGTDDFTDLDFNHLTKTKITVSTGPMLKQNAEVLQELLTSPKIYLMWLDKAANKFRRMAVRLDQSEFRTALKDFQSTNTLPETLTFSFNEERSFSNLNKIWQ